MNLFHIIFNLLYLTIYVLKLSELFFIIALKHRINFPATIGDSIRG
jgi:hypothetical protein